MPPAPSSVTNPSTASPLHPICANINPSTQSKLTGTNGMSAVKITGFNQPAAMQSSQEGPQDKLVEQAKLVSLFSTFRLCVLSKWVYHLEV